MRFDIGNRRWSTSWWGIGRHPQPLVGINCVVHTGGQEFGEENQNCRGILSHILAILQEGVKFISFSSLSMALQFSLVSVRSA